MKRTETARFYVFCQWRATRCLSAIAPHQRGRRLIVAKNRMRG